MHIHPDHLGHHQPQNAEPGEIKALLEYMHHHNDHHIEELADLLDSLPEPARNKLMIAIGSFEAANVELQAVLECLG